MIVVLINELLNKLQEQNIRYVHWKSNTNIEKALVCEDDLDILVNPLDKLKLESVLEQLNILRAYSIKDNWQPQIIHYLGIDSGTNQIVHIHLHYALVLGYDFDKNYNIPLLESYLKNRLLHKNIFLPEVEKEYIILIIRLLLKNSLVPFLLSSPKSQLRRIKHKNDRVILGRGYKEFEDLKHRSNRDRLMEILNNEFNILSWEEFLYFENVLTGNNDLFLFFKAGKRINKILKSYQLKPVALSNFKSLKRLTNIRFNTILNKFGRGENLFGKINAEGGRIFAFVGGDGAGKSTTIETIHKVLSRHYKVFKLHLGRPKKSLKGIFFRVIYTFTNFIGKKDLSVALQYLAIAYDRKNSFEKALIKRRQGYIVLQDRMPFKTIHEMDCPRIKNVASGKFKKLAQKEREIYSHITGVDKLIVLRLNPEIALKRRPEDDPAELLKRSGNIWNNEWTAPYMFTVNTGENNQTQVVGKILEKMWESMSLPYKRVELMGLNGSGKSSLSRFVNENDTNISNVISLKTYPLLSLKTGILEMNSIFKIHRQFRSKGITQAFFSLKVQLKILEKWEKQGKIIYRNFMIDQGPALGYVLAKKEGYWDDFFNERDLALINNFYQLFIFLHAPYEDLYERVKNRNQDVRSRMLSLAEFKDFCQSYENAFQNLKDSTQVPIIEFDSSKMPINEIHERIYSIR